MPASSHVCGTEGDRCVSCLTFSSWRKEVSLKYSPQKMHVQTDSVAVESDATASH